LAEDPSDILDEMGVLRYFNIASQEQMIKNTFVGRDSAEQDALNTLIAVATQRAAQDRERGLDDMAAHVEESVAAWTNELATPDFKTVSKTLMNLNNGAATTPSILTDENLQAIPGLSNIYKVYYEPYPTGDSSSFYSASTTLVPGNKQYSIKNIVSAQPGDPLNGSVGAPKKINPGLSAHVVQYPMISPAVRHSSAVEFFMNGIPPQEFSRCVPYIDMIVRTDGSRGSSGMNIMRFLGAEVDPDEGTSTIGGMLANSVPQVFVDQAGAALGAGEGGTVADVIGFGEAAAFADVLSNDQEAEVQEILKDSSYTTMDIFTMPQSLVDLTNPSELHPVSGEQILDRSRPFMSIKGMTVSHISQRSETIYTVQVKVDLVLHDRSRLADISQLIAPRVYKTTEFLIEYGWSHPDSNPGSDNVYGRFLNAMRHRGVFFLVRSDYTFTQDGQVEVSIILQNASSEKLDNYTVAEGQQIDVGAVTEILRDVIDTTRRSAIGGDQVTAPAALPTAVFKHDNVTDAAMMLPVSTYRQINRQINELTAEGSTATYDDIIASIDGILTGQPTNGDEDPRSMFGILNQKIQNLKREPSDDTLDPFLIVPETADTDYNAVASKFTDRSEYVSFGKLVLALIAHPIAASQDYDEIQVFFHPFNHAAGAFWGLNVSNFPVKLSLLEDKLKEKYSRSRRINISDLFDELAEILEVSSAVPYGVSRAVEATAAEAGEAEGTDADADADDIQIPDRQLDNFLFNRIRNLGCPVAGEFIEPSIAYVIDVLNAVSTTGGPVGSSSAKIMRMHVVDTRQTPHLAQNILLRSLDSSRVALNNSSVTTGGRVSQNIRSALAGYASFHTDSNSSMDVVRSSVSQAAARSWVTDSVPSFKYGINTSGILSLDVRGSTSGPIADAIIMEAILNEQRRRDSSGAEEESQGSDTSIAADLQLVPATITLNTIGCPLLAFGQQYFLSMGTGTTLEQVYGITRLVHNIRAGEFKSSATLYPINSGIRRDAMTNLRSLRRLIREEYIQSQDADPGDPVAAEDGGTP
jgi:hypothetical protein